MDGTRYSSVVPCDGHGQSRLNLSIIAMRLLQVSWSSMKRPHVWSKTFVSKIPVVSKSFHSLSTLFSVVLKLSTLFSGGLKLLNVITSLNTSTSHCGFKMTMLSNSGNSLKLIKTFWSCKKLSTVRNVTSSSIPHSSTATCRASSMNILSRPLLIKRYRTFSYFNHFKGIFSFICGSSLATESTLSLNFFTPWHSLLLPDFVLSTTKKPLRRSR